MTFKKLLIVAFVITSKNCISSEVAINADSTKDEKKASIENTPISDGKKKCGLCDLRFKPGMLQTLHYLAVHKSKIKMSDGVALGHESKEQSQVEKLVATDSYAKAKKSKKIGINHYAFSGGYHKEEWKRTEDDKWHHLPCGSVISKPNNRKRHEDDHIKKGKEFKCSTCKVPTYFKSYAGVSIHHKRCH